MSSARLRRQYVCRLVFCLLLSGLPPFLSAAPAFAFEESSRFVQIRGETAVLRDGAKILTEKNVQSQAAGIAFGDAELTVLQQEGDWNFAENGYVRGYVRQSDLLEAADTPSGGRIVPTRNPMDNPAFTHTLTTAMEVAADKKAALAVRECLISDRNDTWEGDIVRIAGILPKGGLAYVLADEGEEMVYIESGEVRGFVEGSALDMGDAARKKVEEKGEKSFPAAEQILPWGENRAYYYTVTSAADPVAELRQRLIDFALQFVGNPYVYGGDSLTGGIDCSGFVHEVYRHYGYSVPRNSGDLREVGKGIGKDLSEALPGDIVCYEGHVALYIGQGEIVHASNSRPYPRGGIKVSRGDYREIITIRRILW